MNVVSAHIQRYMFAMNDKDTTKQVTISKQVTVTRQEQGWNW